MIKDIILKFLLRPLGRIIGTDRWEAHCVANVRCNLCEKEYVSVFPETTETYNKQTNEVFGLQCPNCGKFSLRSR